MSEDPVTYLGAALHSIGISYSSLKVTDHNPEIFGNFVALAETNVGWLHITYDRGFFVDAPQKSQGSNLIEQIIVALEQHRKLAAAKN